MGPSLASVAGKNHDEAQAANTVYIRSGHGHTRRREVLVWYWRSVSQGWGCSCGRAESGEGTTGRRKRLAVRRSAVVAAKEKEHLSRLVGGRWPLAVPGGEQRLAVQTLCARKTKTVYLCRCLPAPDWLPTRPLDSRVARPA